MEKDAWFVLGPDEKRLVAELLARASLGVTSLKQARRLVGSGCCSVNGRIRTFASARVSKGDRIEVTRPLQQPGPQVVGVIEYEDAWLAVIDKPPGLVVAEEPIAQAFPGRWFLVHRLDRETSGLLLLAKTKDVQLCLEGLFFKRVPLKEYLAIVDGELAQETGTITKPLRCVRRSAGQVYWGTSPDGKPACTRFTRLFVRNGATLVKLTPLTGRTHQLRVHMQSIGHPILGDYHYADQFVCCSRPGRQMLHAWKLSLPHPVTHLEMCWRSPLPEDMKQAAMDLFGRNLEKKLCEF